jgi:hypothetical protein
MSQRVEALYPTAQVRLRFVCSDCVRAPRFGWIRKPTLYPLSYEGRGQGHDGRLSPSQRAISLELAPIASQGTEGLAQPWPNGATSEVLSKLANTVRASRRDSLARSASSAEERVSVSGSR